jgi:hypothetical protein
MNGSGMMSAGRESRVQANRSGFVAALPRFLDFLLKTKTAQALA